MSDKRCGRCGTADCLKFWHCDDLLLCGPCADKWFAERKWMQTLQGTWVTDARERCAGLEAEVARLKAQLPEGMEDCSIQFKECEKGHGRLMATNWVEHGCPWCEIAQLRQENNFHLGARSELICMAAHQRLERSESEVARLRERIMALESAIRAHRAAWIAGGIVKAEDASGFDKKLWKEVEK